MKIAHVPLKLDENTVAIKVHPFAPVGTAYVSKAGSDETGNGTPMNPFATVKRAVEDGALRVIVKNG